MHGLGIGAIGFDWSTISSYLGSPLGSPWFATAKIAVGYSLCVCCYTSYVLVQCLQGQELSNILGWLV